MNDIGHVGFNDRDRIKQVIAHREQDAGTGLVLANRKSDLHAWFDMQDLLDYDAKRRKAVEDWKAANPGKKLPATR